jgi:hypothetical protein
MPLPIPPTRINQLEDDNQLDEVTNSRQRRNNQRRRKEGPEEEQDELELKTTGGQLQETISFKKSLQDAVRNNIKLMQQPSLI